MAITVNIPTTAAQDLQLDRILIRVNAQRGTSYPSVDAMCRALLIEELQALRQADEAIERELETSYKAASPVVQAQVRALLGVA